jgi:hypothetical protein
MRAYLDNKETAFFFSPLILYPPKIASMTSSSSKPDLAARPETQGGRGKREGKCNSARVGAQAPDPRESSI